jgi:hypothetical protein
VDLKPHALTLRRVRSLGGGRFDDAVGFPGATDYLANALPKLGEYFAGAAKNLTDHEH